MTLVQLINDAGNAINRVIQQVEEKIFDTDRTEYDDEYAGNVKKLNILMHLTEVLIEDTESMLEPNPAFRLEGKIMEKVDKKYDRNTPLESLGVAFDGASRDVKQYNYELYKDFALCSKYQTKLGATSKEFQNSATDIYVSKLKQMLYLDLQKYKEEEEILENLRLDYDSLRIRIGKAITVIGKESLEKEFVQVKKNFFNKLESNNDFFRGIDQFFDIHRELLKEFVESQSKYYKDCFNELEKFKGKMISRSLSTYYGQESDNYRDSRPPLSKYGGTKPISTRPDRPLNSVPEMSLPEMKLKDPKDCGRKDDSGNIYDTIQLNEEDNDETNKFVLIHGQLNVNGSNYELVNDSPNKVDQSMIDNKENDEGRSVEISLKVDLVGLVNDEDSTKNCEGTKEGDLKESSFETLKNADGNEIVDEDKNIALEIEGNGSEKVNNGTLFIKGEVEVMKGEENDESKIGDKEKNESSSEEIGDQDEETKNKDRNKTPDQSKDTKEGESTDATTS